MWQIDETNIVVHGRLFETRVFGSDVDANIFIARNEGWAVLAETRAGVHVAKKDDKGQPLGDGAYAFVALDEDGNQMDSTVDHVQGDFFQKVQSFKETAETFLGFGVYVVVYPLSSTTPVNVQ